MRKILFGFLVVLICFTSIPAHAVNFTSASIGAQNTWTTALYPIKDFNISVSGTWTGTVSVQRSFDGGTTWVTVVTYTANAETQGFEPEQGVAWRIGIATGAYGSGTAVVRLSQ